MKSRLPIIVDIAILWSRNIPLHWCHNDHDSVSYHQPHGYLLNRLFRRRSKKTSKFRVTGLCVGNSPGPVNSPHKGPVMRKMFPFHDVIILCVVAFPLDDHSRVELKMPARKNHTGFINANYIHVSIWPIRVNTFTKYGTEMLKS